MKKLLTYIGVIIIFVLPGCSGKSDKSAIKVMTFNIRYDNPGDSANSWPNRASQIYNFILNEKPDILGMQEVLWKQYENIDSVLKDYTSTAVGRDDGARAGETNPVFFRKEKFDMVRTITFWLSDTPEVPGSKGWGASLPRVVTWMELVEKESHDHFFYFNTHFAHDSDSARIMSANLLLREVGKITEGSPFIITGDFNLQPSDTGYTILTGPAESVPLLKDSFLVSEKRPVGPSYTFNGFSDSAGKRRIDYIFIRNGMKVLEHRTFIKKEKGVFISDHWPVEARISLK
jgi:endonuclease/exonuclease/phosphatase family metal-dependent hydrolase